MDLNSGTLWGISGVVIGIIGIVVAIIIHLRDNRKYVLKYNISTTPIMYDTVTKIENLTIKYNEQPIDNLYCSKIEIKNNSKNIIEQNHFDSREPLTVSTDGMLLLKKQVPSTQKVYLTIPDSESDITPKNALISYEYFPENETISLTVYHVGSIFISGKLKSGKIVKMNKPDIKIIYSLSKLFIIIVLTFVINLLIVRCIEAKNLNASSQAQEKAIQTQGEAIQAKEEAIQFLEEAIQAKEKAIQFLDEATQAENEAAQLLDEAEQIKKQVEQLLNEESSKITN